MDAIAIYSMIRDSMPEDKRGKNMDLPENFTERDALRAIDGYFQELVRGYRERKGKERDEGVEQTASAILLSLMGYEVEGGAKAENMDEVVDALKYLVNLEHIRTLLSESNGGMVESLYRKYAEMEKMQIEMGD